MTDQAEGGTSYDAYAYPSAIFRHSHPDRLAVLGRLVGLPTPAPETARVLEVAGGDGLNSIALAAAYPRARFVNFDLAATAIAQGAKWSAEIGQTNITHLALDVMDASEALDGQFDYVIVHGLYAWVPDFVRAEILPLIARKLAPGGVAFLSFDALPGSHMRIALRQILHYAGARPDIPQTQRIAVARQVLHDIAERGKETHFDDHPWHAMIGQAAAQSLTKRDAVLVHDDVGEDYHPQMLANVVRLAEDLDLTFIGDALDGRLGELFLPDDAAEVSGPAAQAAILHQAQSNDITRPHFFRRAVLTRAGVTMTRRIVPEVFDTLWLSAKEMVRDGNSFTVGERNFQLGDDALADLIGEAIAVEPGNLPLAGRVTSLTHARALFSLFDADVIGLHAGPSIVATQLSDTPVASPLARMMAEADMDFVVTLDHHLATLDEPVKKLLLRLDGSRTHEQLRRNATALGFDNVENLERSLDHLRRHALLIA